MVGCYQRYNGWVCPQLQLLRGLSRQLEAFRPKRGTLLYPHRSTCHLYSRPSRHHLSAASGSRTTLYKDSHPVIWNISCTSLPSALRMPVTDTSTLRSYYLLSLAARGKWNSTNSVTNFRLAPFMALTIAPEQRLGASVLMTTKHL